jgi:hypothetical protein
MRPEPERESPAFMRGEEVNAMAVEFVAALLAVARGRSLLRRGGRSCVGRGSETIAARAVSRPASGRPSTRRSRRVRTRARARGAARAGCAEVRRGAGQRRRRGQAGRAPGVAGRTPRAHAALEFRAGAAPQEPWLDRAPRRAVAARAARRFRSHRPLLAAGTASLAPQRRRGVGKRRPRPTAIHAVARRRVAPRTVDLRLPRRSADPPLRRGRRGAGDPVAAGSLLDRGGVALAPGRLSGLLHPPVDRPQQCASGVRRRGRSCGHPRPRRGQPARSARSCPESRLHPHGKRRDRVARPHGRRRCVARHSGSGALIAGGEAASSGVASPAAIHPAAPAWSRQSGTGSRQREGRRPPVLEPYVRDVRRNGRY